MNNLTRSYSLSTPLKAALICFFISMMGFSITKYFSGVNDIQYDSQPEMIKILKFQDHKDGSVIVIDAISNEVIDIVQGEAGFIRGVLRTVTRERKMRGIGDDMPMQLAAYTDGRLILNDPSTKTKIELKSFGSSNVEEFRVFLNKNKKS